MDNSIIILLSAFLGDYRNAGNSCSFNCPEDHPDHHGGDVDYKLSAYPSKGFFKCWVCGYSGRISSLVWKYGSEYYSEYKHYANAMGFSSEVASHSCRIPSDLIPAKGKVLKRAKSRLPIEAVKFYMLSQSESLKRAKDRLIIPSVGIDGDIDYYMIDNFPEKKPKYLQPSSWDYETSSFVSVPKTDYIMNAGNIEPTVPLIIVEGFYNAASFFPYTNVTWLNGKDFYPKLEDFVLKNRIPTFVWLDNEPKANDNSDRFVELCRNNKLYSAKIGEYEYKDPNDYLLSNGGQEKIQKIVNKNLNKWKGNTAN